MPINSRHALGCTAKAISHRVQKFRDATSQLGLGDGSPLPATPGTGKKRGRKTTNTEGQNADGVDVTPTKKPRTPKTKKKAADAENDDDAKGDENTKTEVDGSVKPEAVEEDGA